MRQLICFFSALLLILAALPTHAKVLHVEKWGQDSDYCGSAADPCATIGKAIENANPGNTVLVGPGTYGDINGDGDFDEYGEESCPSMMGNCVVCVDKDNLKLESTMGAAHTLIDGDDSIAAGVCLRGTGVSFGKKKGGFTVRHARKGVVLEAQRLTVQYIRAVDNTLDGFYGEGAGGPLVLVGNTALRDRVGFNFEAVSDQPYVTLFAENRMLENNSAGARLYLKTGVTVRDNVIVENNTGFSLVAGGGTLVKGNLAVENTASGISVNKYGNLPKPIRVTGNGASRNGESGFDLTRVDEFIQNSATDNGIGVFCRATKIQFLKNSITGNRKVGIVFANVGTTPANIVMQKNNLFANGWNGSNCGLQNDTSAALTVRRNFWGDPAGPGPDPADNTCGDPVTDSSPRQRPLKMKVKTAALY